MCGRSRPSRPSIARTIVERSSTPPAGDTAMLGRRMHARTITTKSSTPPAENLETRRPAETRPAETRRPAETLLMLSLECPSKLTMKTPPTSPLTAPRLHLKCKERSSIESPRNQRSSIEQVVAESNSRNSSRRNDITRMPFSFFAFRISV